MAESLTAAELQAACIECEETLTFAAEIAGMALDRAMLIDGPALKMMESPESVLKTAFGLVTTLHGLQRLLNDAAGKLERLDLYVRPPAPALASIDLDAPSRHAGQ